LHFGDLFGVIIEFLWYMCSGHVFSHGVIQLLELHHGHLLSGRGLDVHTMFFWDV
jgi:hypothetical protein